MNGFLTTSKPIKFYSAEIFSTGTYATDFLLSGCLHFKNLKLSQQLYASGFQSITLEDEKGTRLADTRDGISSVPDYNCRLLT